MRSEVFTHRARRWCRVRHESSPEGDLFPLDDDGFLGSDHLFALSVSEAPTGALVSPDEVAQEGATVLLGEPGAGKTSVFSSVVDGLPVLDEPFGGGEEDDRCLWIDGADLTSETFQEVLGRHLLALPNMASGPSPGPGTSGTLTVVIDQADESEICRNLPGYLKRSLRKRDVRGLRLLIACRTGDYPPGLTRVLHDAFGRCSLVDLAPLARADAVALAESAGVPGEELIAEIVSLRAGALASVPLTLELIVRRYRESGRLRGGAVELFKDGVRLLAQEYDPERLRLAAPTTTWPQRLEVAGRIAARLVLSGRRSLWSGSFLSERPRPTDLDFGTVVGGLETWDLQDFDVTPAVAEEVLRSGLFTASGNDRFVFRHSSIAAFLTARHLVSRSVTEGALRRLFLVGVPDEETAGIPVSLRETAAWMVALDPDRVKWLAAADPESLTVHSGLVRSDKVKELIVGRLLERAADVELGDVRWQRSRWALEHPGLARQLLPALTLDPGGFGDWPTWARARVALHLAEQCPSPDLAVPLLELAADAKWPAANRAQAARAAFGCDAELAAPALREVLHSLDRTAGADPDLGLRGTLLTLLWPRSLDTATVLAALGEAPSDDRYGAYEHFVAGVAAACPEEDVNSLVEWLVQRTTDGAASPRHREWQGFDRFVSGVVDRALRASDAGSLLPSVARILTTRLTGHSRTALPTVLNPVTVEGSEPTAVRDLRRELASAMIVCGLEEEQNMRYFSWLVVREWEAGRSSLLQREGLHGDRMTLLDAEDFAWALDRAAACTGSAALAEAHAHLAEVLFDQQSREHFDLAYRSQGNPAWPYLEWFFQPIEIHGELAKAWRRNDRGSAAARWPESARFVVEQRARLEMSRAHDTDSFWKLLWNLQRDPSSGNGPRRFDCDITDWPGCSVFSEEELASLPACALEFLRRENDHSDEWLGSGTEDKRAWAGFLSLALLHRTGRLEELEPDRWDAWVGAIVDPWCDFSGPRAELLRKAADHVPLGLSRAIRTLAEAQLGEGSQPLVLERIEATWSPDVTGTMEDLLALLSATFWPDYATGRTVGVLALSEKALAREAESRSALVRTWSALLTGLLAAGSPFARSVAEYALGPVVVSGESGDLRLPVLAACSLVRVDGADGWSKVEGLVDASEPFSRAFAFACAGRSERGYMEEVVDERGLGRLYRWLDRHFAQDEYSRPLGVHVVTPEMELAEWRESLPVVLSRCGTPAAVEELRSLVAEFPARLGLRASLVAARTRLLAATWTPADLDEVVAILAGACRISEPLSDQARLVEAMEAFQDMGSHGFRQGIVRDMQIHMRSDRFLPIADHNVARDHLWAIAGYVCGEGGEAARYALVEALRQARPDDRALEPLSSLLRS
ncbi:NACHT domain-containing protein [Kitasatospora sp. NBC_00458]|uniref:NACHT domain-containing protein n=1 Tax=Kitasatospora sp. NBC_00458 TaxID=2903568 RepID=UPI002E17818E